MDPQDRRVKAIDGPTPREAVRDLGLELDHEAQLLVARTLRLARIHEKAIARDLSHEPPAAPAPESHDLE